MQIIDLTHGDPVTQFKSYVFVITAMAKNFLPSRDHVITRPYAHSSPNYILINTSKLNLNE